MEEEDEEGNDGKEEGSGGGVNGERRGKWRWKVGKG